MTRSIVTKRSAGSGSDSRYVGGAGSGPPSDCHAAASAGADVGALSACRQCIQALGRAQHRRAFTDFLFQESPKCWGGLEGRQPAQQSPKLNWGSPIERKRTISFDGESEERRVGKEWGSMFRSRG